MKASLVAISLAAAFDGAAAAGLRRSLIASHDPSSPTYPCNPNPYGNALVCTDNNYVLFHEAHLWKFCGEKNTYTDSWENRKFCPVGRYQCQSGFCSRTAAGCNARFNPVKYGPEACPNAPAPPKPAKACGDDEHSITDLACRANQTVAEFCFEHFPGQHNCDNGDFGMPGGLTCVSSLCDGHKGYICPANSYPTEKYARPTSFDDCSCDNGLAKVGGVCTVDLRAQVESLQMQVSILQEKLVEATAKLAGSVPRPLLVSCLDTVEAFRKTPCGVTIPTIGELIDGLLPDIDIPDIEIPVVEFPLL